MKLYCSSINLNKLFLWNLGILLGICCSLSPGQAQDNYIEAHLDTCYHDHQHYDTQVYSRLGRMKSGRLDINRLPQPTSQITINYSSNVPKTAQEALNYATYILSTVLVSEVPIKIYVGFVSYGSGILASAGPGNLHRDFAPAAEPGVWYPDALADAIAGKDLSTGSDVRVTFNSNINWYYGTDLQAGGQFDFITIALHELMHGLGFSFTGGYFSSTKEGSIHPATLTKQYADINNVNLLNYTSPSIELGSQFTSGKVFLNGRNSVGANDGKFPKIHAPSSYLSGTSMSHLDESTYRPGNANSLMSPYFGRGEAVHDISPMICGILKDMGWQINPAYENLPEPEPEPEPDPEPSTYLPAVTPSNPQAGLQYYLYQGEWSDIPDFTSLTALDSGIIHSFDGFSRRLPEQFGLQIQGYFQAPTQGTYTLYVQGADELQLFVHGEQVINFSGTSAESLDSAVLHLEAGYHPFYTYYLRRAPGIQFASQMKSPDGQINAIPQEYLFYDAGTADSQTTASSLAQGIQYAYYEGSWQSLPDFSSLEPVEKGLIDNFSLLPRHKEQDYAFVYQGFINAPAHGVYQFYLNSSDGSRLYINDSLIVDNDGIHTMTQSQGVHELSQGTHAVRIEFFNAQGGGSLSAEVQLEGFERRSISTAELFYDTQNPDVSSFGSMIKTEFTDVMLFPNPTTGSFVLEFNAPVNRAEVIMRNSLGKVVHHADGVPSGTQLQLDSEQPGLYLVQVLSAGQTKVFKLMLE